MLAIHMIRTYAGEEPRVVSAHASRRNVDIDVSMAAEFALASGASGGFACSLRSPVSLNWLRIVGDRGNFGSRTRCFLTRMTACSSRQTGEIASSVSDAGPAMNISSMPSATRYYEDHPF